MGTAGAAARDGRRAAARDGRRAAARDGRLAAARDGRRAVARDGRRAAARDGRGIRCLTEHLPRQGGFCGPSLCIARHETEAETEARPRFHARLIPRIATRCKAGIALRRRHGVGPSASPGSALRHGPPGSALSAPAAAVGPAAASLRFARCLVICDASESLRRVPVSGHRAIQVVPRRLGQEPMFRGPRDLESGTDSDTTGSTRIHHGDGQVSRDQFRVQWSPACHGHVTVTVGHGRSPGH
jgi:hypothetical protein